MSGQQSPRGVVSPIERHQPAIGWTLRVVHLGLLAFLLVAGLGPLVWLVKASLSSTQDTLRTPLGWFPSGVDRANLEQAWHDAQISRYFWNTVRLAIGSWAVQLVVAVTGAYVLAILRPWYARLVTGLVLATLFVPPVVLLVPLFLTVLDLPVTGGSLLNSYWAVWLPAGASAFNLLLVKRFFEELPRELLDAARVDGAGPVRLLWYVVLPLSRPILGVVPIFAIILAWKDFLWPLVVLSEPTIQPLSVRLPTVRRTLPLDVFLAALLISTAIPVALFLAFQRSILRGVGMGGSVKG